MEANSIQACSRNFIKGSCANGHLLAKQIVCGKEYCPECGKADSITHKRKVARWWPKIFSFKTVGYLVVTCPAELREMFKDRELLSEWKKYGIRILKEAGYEAGMFRFHWFGDCENCNGQGCEICKFTGAGTIWKPHLNFIINSKYIEKSKFEEWTNFFKRKFQIFFESICGTDLTDKMNVYYQYRKTKAEICHTLKYVTRATHRIYNKEIANLLHGFRASQTWGKFETCEVEQSEFNEVIQIEKGICPCCKTKITWQKDLIPRMPFMKINRVDLGAGYFQLTG